ncbi:MAG: TetR/AcrR family transcriptional regulator [Dehalococcoidia bacterium]
MSESPSTAKTRSSRIAAKRSPLSAERIVLAAVKLIDQDGFNSFSMRKLGRSLGVEAMSLYEYFESKEAILLAVRAHFYRQLEIPVAPGTPWYEELGAVLTASYRMGVEHPSFVAVHLHVLSVPESRRRGEHDMALLREAGFTEDEAAGAMVALVSFMIGFLHRMVLTTPAANPLAHKSRDAAFELGLNAILQGLRAHANERRGQA